MNTSAIKFQHNEPEFVPDKNTAVKRHPLMSHVTHSKPNNEVIIENHLLQPLQTRKFTIEETLILEGKTKCNVKVDLSDYMIFDDERTIHFKDIGVNKSISKQQVTVSKIVTQSGQEEKFEAEEKHYSGTWSVKSYPKGKVTVAVHDKEGKFLKSFEGWIEEIVADVAKQEKGFERICTEDGAVISRGTYSGVSSQKCIYSE